MTKALKLWGLFLVCIAVAGISTAHAEFIIDDFDAPETITFPVISGYDPDPSLVETADAAILGGERDLLLDVMGTPRLVSFSGEIGGGNLQFNSSSPGTAATLQYDGVDMDVMGPPAALVNAEALGAVDLTAYGPGFLLDLSSIDGGGAQVTGIEIVVHSGATVATFADVIPDSNVPIQLEIPFASFSDPGVLSAVTSIEFRFNPSGAEDVDFTLEKVAVVPEPATLMMLASCGLGLVTLWRRKRNV